MQFQHIICIGSIIIAFIAVLWLSICVVLKQKLPNQLHIHEDYNYTFDYIVVGAGTSGSVVASLLAKHSNLSILLIEAGDKFGLISKIPLLATLQQKGINDWSFLSVPQKHSSYGLKDNQQCLPRGKGIGGTSLLNYMLRFEGNENDFNHWANEYNLSEWHFTKFQPFLKAAQPKSYETYEVPKLYSTISEAFHQAQYKFAYKTWQFQRARYDIKNGLRFTVLQRFLEPAMNKKNLHILTNAMAKQLILSEDGQQVKYLIVGLKDDTTKKEQIVNIEIRRELILAAGAYQTPQLLLVSGIGDAKALNTLGIEVQKHLPQVGKNLHDHFNMPLYVSIDTIGPTLNQRALLDPINLLKYLFNGSGHFGNFGVIGQVYSKYAEHFSLTLFAAGAIDESALMTISNFQNDYFYELFPRYYNATQEGMVLISTCVQPKSRGNVFIKSQNMRQNPLIDTNYLSASEDVTCTINAIRSLVEIIKSRAFVNFNPHIHWPHFKACMNSTSIETEPSDQYLECVMRHIGLSSHHPGGTCAMGIHPQNSVVDQQFRVHNLKNLRIVDASVQPTPISGNPHAVIVAMAVRAATRILKTEQNDRKHMLRMKFHK